VSDEQRKKAERRPRPGHLLDWFLACAKIDWIRVEEPDPPAPDFIVTLSDGRRVGVELTAASRNLEKGLGAARGTLAEAIERKSNKVTAYRKAGGAAEVWLVVHTTATVEGRDGLAQLEREQVGACNFDRLYLFDVFNLRALQRWPGP
jgi:hypothetical protein